MSGVDDDLDGLETGAETGGERQARLAPEPDAVEARAREDGWKPEGEWKGDKSKWQPADRFVLKGSARRREVEELRNQLSERDAQHERQFARLANATASAIERATTQKLENLRAAKEEAGVAGDRKTYRELERLEDEERALAAKDIAAARAPVVSAAAPENPATTAWRAKNEWFDRDPVLKGAALTAYNEVRTRFAAGRQLKEEDFAPYEAFFLSEVDRAIEPRIKGNAASARQTQRADYMPDMEGGGSGRQLSGGGGRGFDSQAEERACREAYKSLTNKRPGLFKDFDDYKRSYFEDN